MEEQPSPEAQLPPDFDERIQLLFRIALAEGVRMQKGVWIVDIPKKGWEKVPLDSTGLPAKTEGAYEILLETGKEKPVGDQEQFMTIHGPLRLQVIGRGGLATKIRLCLGMTQEPTFALHFLYESLDELEALVRKVVQLPRTREYRDRTHSLLGRRGGSRYVD